MPRPDGSIPSELVQLGYLAFSDSDYGVLNQNFKKASLYEALIGSEGFAKCFITAEYLYRAIKSGQYFDYTAVACGYLKAVEQLIYKLLKINLNYPTSDKLWIMKNSKRIPGYKYRWDDTVRKNPDPDFDSIQVTFESDYEPYFNTTLTPMINFLHDNKSGWYISAQGQDVLYQLLLNYAKDYRNDSFHKDNIDEHYPLECVRNNTLLIIYILLGGYKLSGNPETDKKELGILDDLFDRFYRSIKQNTIGSQYKFILYYPGKAPIKAFRHHVQELAIYDEYGFRINDSKTWFKSKKSRRKITGLIITDTGRVSVGTETRKKIKHMIYNRLVNGNGSPDEILGYLAYLKDVEPQVYNKYIIKYSTYCDGDVISAIRQGPQKPVLKIDLPDF